MVKNAEFERCADFLVRMIEKYGNEIALPKTADDKESDHYDENDAKKVHHCPEQRRCVLDGFHAA